MKTTYALYFVAANLDEMNSESDLMFFINHRYQTNQG